MAEGAPLLRAYTLIAYRGFESLLLRQVSTESSCLSRAFLLLMIFKRRLLWLDILLTVIMTC